MSGKYWPVQLVLGHAWLVNCLCGQSVVSIGQCLISCLSAVLSLWLVGRLLSGYSILVTGKLVVNRDL